MAIRPLLILNLLYFPALCSLSPEESQHELSEAPCFAIHAAPDVGATIKSEKHFRPSFELLEDRRVLSGASFLSAPIIPAIDPAMLAHLAAIRAEGLRLGNQD